MEKIYPVVEVNYYNDWNISYEVAVNQSILDKYNEENNTEYIWMTAAFKTVEVDGALTFVIVSEPATGSYTTDKGDSCMIDMKFDIQVTDVTATSAKIKVVPEDLEQTYIWCYDPYDESTKDMTPMQIAEQFGDIIIVFLQLYSVLSSKSP